MNYIQLIPKSNRWTNTLLKGFGKVPDLPVTKFVACDENEQPITHTVSYYKVSFRDRLKFLFSGDVYLCIRADTHPPIAVGIGEFFQPVSVEKPYDSYAGVEHGRSR
jgi:hypothetical protein